MMKIHSFEDIENNLELLLKTFKGQIFLKQSYPSVPPLINFIKTGRIVQ